MTNSIGGKHANLRLKFGSKQPIVAVAVAAAVAGALIPARHAAASAYYWDGNGASWNTPADWSTTAGSITASAVVPGAADTVTFNTTILNTNQAITLDGNQSIRGITFASTGATTINQGTSGTLTLGSAGLTLSSGAGVATINAPLALIGAQTWTAASGTTLAVAGTFTHTGATVDFTNFNAAATLTGLTNDATGIIGDWATTGSGTTLSYVMNTGGAVGAYTGTVAPDGSFLGNSATTNYELANSGGAVPAIVSANTIRYSGGTGTTAPGATSFTVNGLMNAGTGLWTIGTNAITIGANKELVVLSNTQGITISSVIKDNAGGASSLTYSGTGTLTLSGINTYSGGTTINSGTLKEDLTSRTVSPPLGNISIGSAATLELFNTNTGVDNQGGLMNTTTFSGSGTINKTGLGYLDFWTPVHIAGFSGTINVLAGTLATQAADWASASGITLNIGANGTFDLRNASIAVNQLTGPVGAVITDSFSANTITVGGQGGTSTFNGVINSGSAAISLTKTGTGLFTLTGANTYTGATNVNGGTLAVNTGGAINSANGINVGGGTAAGTLTIAGGSVATSLAGNRSFTVGFASNGTFNISSGSLSLSSTSGGIVLGDGGTAQWTQTGGTVTLSGNSGFYTGNGNTVSGTSQLDISGGTLTASNSGFNFGQRSNSTLNVSNTAVVTLGALNSGGSAASTDIVNIGDGVNFTGGASIAAGGTSGILALPSMNKTSGTLTVNFKGGTLKPTAPSAAFMGTAAVSVQDAGGIIDNNGNAITISPILAHGGVASTDGGLIFKGSSTTTLLGANTYNGGSTISAGTLQIGNGTTNGTFGSGTYSISNGATLKINNGAGGGTPPTWAHITSGATATLELATALSFDHTSFDVPSLPAGFTGTLQIDGGRVVGSGAAGQGLGGTATINVMSGGQFAMYNNGPAVTQNFTIAGTGYGESTLESALRFGNSTISGTIALSASATIGAGPGNTGTISNTISGPGGANLTLGTSFETGNIIFSKANTYSGATTVATGTLSLTGTGTLGSGNVIVNSNLDISGITPTSLSLQASQTLSGAGTILAAGKTLAVSTGTLAPGLLTISGTGSALSFASGSTYSVQLAGATAGNGAGKYNQTNLTGTSATASLGGNLRVSLAYNAGPSDTYTILTASSITGAFANAPITGPFTDSVDGTSGTITYNPGSVVLSNVVPEPTTLGLLALGSVGLLARRRRSTMAPR